MKEQLLHNIEGLRHIVAHSKTGQKLLNEMEDVVRKCENCSTAKPAPPNNPMDAFFQECERMSFPPNPITWRCRGNPDCDNYVHCVTK